MSLPSCQALSSTTTHSTPITFLVWWVTLIWSRSPLPSYKKVVPGFSGKYSLSILVANSAVYLLRVAEQTSPAAYAARHVGHKDSGCFRLSATQRPPLDLEKMYLLIEVLCTSVQNNPIWGCDRSSEMSSLLPRTIGGAVPWAHHENECWRGELRARSY